jgi:hypothetical protein
LTPAKSGYTTLKVYDILGREMVTLIDGNLGAGAHGISWNASDCFLLRVNQIFCKYITLEEYTIQTGNRAISALAAGYLRRRAS